MNIGIIASRYADALLKYVKETGEGQVVYKQVCTLADALAASGDFVRLVESKTLLSVSEKLGLMSKALGEEKMSQSLSKFLGLVLRQVREQYLRYILQDFKDRWLSSQGICQAKLVVSMPSPELETKICEMIKNLTGLQLELTVSVDSSIIGGFVFEVADKRIDASVSRQLEDLRRRFIEQNNRMMYESE